MNLILWCFSTVCLLSLIGSTFGNSLSVRTKRTPVTNNDWRNYRKNKLNQTNSTIVTTVSTTSLNITETSSSTTTTSINSTTSSLSNEKLVERIVIEEQVNDSSNLNLNSSNLLEKPPETVLIPNQEDPNVSSKLPTNENSNSENGWWEFLCNLKFDNSTLIMTSAFFAGILLIAGLVLLSICICKRLGRKKSPRTQSTNPAYDKIPKSEIDFLGSSESLNSKRKIYKGDTDLVEVRIESPGSKRDSTNETEKLLSQKVSIELTDLNKNDQIDSADKKPLNTSIQTSISLGSSSSSIDSQVLKTPITPVVSKYDKESLNRTPINIKSSISSLAQKLTGSNQNLDPQTPLIPADETPTKRTPKFTPSALFKTQQQLDKERKYTFTRANSESNDQDQVVSQLPPVPPSSFLKRISITSSSSSIVPNQNQSQLDFTAIQNGVDEMIIDIKNNPSAQSSMSNLNSDSVHNSVSNIYITEIRNIREKQKEAKEKNKNDRMNRRSVNLPNTSVISTDPTGSSMRINDSGFNLNKTDTGSVNTLESEKSCY